MSDEMLDAWDGAAEEASTITTEELDAAAKQFAEAREDYEQKKSISNEAYHHAEECKAKLMDLMSKANKKKYSVEGLGSLSVVEKLKVRAPKNLEEKQALYNWLKQEFGESAEAFLSINHNTLNKLYNEKFEEEAANGNDFKMPGVEEPQTERNIQFRRSK